jgi:endonuclease
MPIYDKPVRELMKDAAAALGATTARPIARRDMVGWFEQHYPDIKKATVSAHLLKMSANAPSRIHYSVRPDGSDDLLFQIDAQRFRRYNPAADPAPIYERQPDTLDEEEEDPGPEAETSAFAYERDLRNYLSKNMTAIQPGLRLYEEEDIKGIEFPVGGRFIDLLAVDDAGSLVVIELTVSRGYDRVVGQLLRYMGWIENNLAEPAQRVRGIIVANEISEDLRLACFRLQDVELFEYEMAVTLRKLDPIAAGG